MNCRKFRILLSSYVDGEITDIEEKAAVIKHIGACSGCKAELDRLNVTKNLFTLRTPAATNEFFETRLAARIEEYGKQPVWLRIYLPVLRKSLPGIAVLLIVAAGVLNVNRIFGIFSPDDLNGLSAEYLQNSVMDSDLIEIYYGQSNGRG